MDYSPRIRVMQILAEFCLFWAMDAEPDTAGNDTDWQIMTQPNPRKPFVITLDGPAGSGKSAVAHRLAEALGFHHLDTGAMYRAVALDAMEQGLTDDPQAMALRVNSLKLDFDWSRQPAHILLNGRDVAEAIRAPEVTRLTYTAADNPAVRSALVQSQRLIAEKIGAIVTEGRDQGTVVFPHAAYKFYLDANIEERARRRVAELVRKGTPITLHDMVQQLQTRDSQDQARATGPLAIPKGACIVDTTHLSLEQVVNELARRITFSPNPVAP